ncbi:hypothetical protein CTI14_06830 [Methylobacterium radiotolerans]|nr:hypothetical protein CTI14_06830 [Methylobacterium radiotolerans]
MTKDTSTELSKAMTTVARAAVGMVEALEQEVRRHGPPTTDLATLARQYEQEHAEKVKAMEQRHERATAALWSRWKRY